MFNLGIRNVKKKSTKKIPKIIHQTYKNHNLPETYRICQREIKRLHPDFEYRFYTDQDMDVLMKTEFPEYYDKFNVLSRMIMKIDMFRYFLMYKYGGLYVDMDYYMFKPFDLLEYDVVIPCNKEDSYGKSICLGNCIFASCRGHKFWKILMDTLFTIDRTKKEYSYDKNIDENSLGTGPMFVYSRWREYSKEKRDIYIPRKQLFHPLSKKEDEHMERLKKTGHYGMHICAGLWRDKKL